MFPQTSPFQRLSGPGMNGEDDRKAPADLHESSSQSFETLGPIDVGGAMKRENRVLLQVGLAGRTGESMQSLPCRHGSLQVPQERIDHHVADEVDAPVLDPLPEKVLAGASLGREQQIRKPIGQDPVDLLGHAVVEAAEARLDVNHGHPLLGRHQRAGDRGIDVADDENRDGTGCVDDRLEPPHDLGRLDRVAGAAHLQIRVRFGNAELAEERTVHLDVVVLARVDQTGRARDRGLPQRGDDRRDLDEIRPRTDDAEDRVLGEPVE